MPRWLPSDFVSDRWYGTHERILRYKVDLSLWLLSTFVQEGQGLLASTLGILWLHQVWGIFGNTRNIRECSGCSYLDVYDRWIQDSRIVRCPIQEEKGPPESEGNSSAIGMYVWRNAGPCFSTCEQDYAVKVPSMTECLRSYLKRAPQLLGDLRINKGLIGCFRGDTFR